MMHIIHIGPAATCSISVAGEDPEAVFTAFNDNGKWVTTLFVQPKDILQEIWEGSALGVEGAVKNWPIDNALSHDELGDSLSNMLVKCSRILVKLGS